MKVRKIVTAEGRSGVAAKIEDFDTDNVKYLRNLWGFDQIPDLPLSAAQALGEYKKMGIFGPSGSFRVHLVVAKPEPQGGPAWLRKIRRTVTAIATALTLDFGTKAGLVAGKEGEGMHRTNSIDLVVVIEGEMSIAYPVGGGELQEITITAGDFIVHNGTFHTWHNRTTKDCVMLFVVIGTDRQTS
jgi:hypothetical protein